MEETGSYLTLIYVGTRLLLPCVSELCCGIRMLLELERATATVTKLPKDRISKFTLKYS